MNRRLVTILTFLLILAWSSGARADKVHLKNGRTVQGIIIEESEERVVLNVGAGRTWFSWDQVEKVVRGSPEENEEIIEKWTRQKFPVERKRPVKKKRLKKVPVEPASQKVAGSEAEAKEHFYKGSDYMQMGRYDDAIKEYSKAIEIDPEYVEAYSNLGLAYHNKGKDDDALRALKKAIEINPDNADSHYALGVFYRDKRQYSLAKKEFERAVFIDPYHRLAREALWWLKWEKRK